MHIHRYVCVYSICFKTRCLCGSQIFSHHRHTFVSCNHEIRFLNKRRKCEKWTELRAPARAGRYVALISYYLLIRKITSKHSKSWSIKSLSKDTHAMNRILNECRWFDLQIANSLMDAKPDHRTPCPTSTAAQARGPWATDSRNMVSLVNLDHYLYRMSLTNRQLNNQMTSAPANDIVTIVTKCSLLSSDDVHFHVHVHVRGCY